jgi:hypothetical protein
MTARRSVKIVTSFKASRAKDARAAASASYWRDARKRARRGTRYLAVWLQAISARTRGNGT